MTGAPSAADARVGVLGGMFDPIHLGHVAAAAAAQQALDLDRIVLVPSGRPPHRATPLVASAADRMTMATLAATGRPGWSASDMELTREGPTYTFDTLTAMARTEAPAWRLHFITGVDAFLEVATWSRYPAVLDLAHFVVVARPGSSLAALGQMLPAVAPRMIPAGDFVPTDGGPTAVVLLQTVTPDVSSTEVRRRARVGESLDGLVPDGVGAYIASRRLYAGR